MYLDSSVALDLALVLNECVWFPNLSLKVVDERPMYCMVLSVSEVTVALYTMFLLRHLPSNGQLGFDFFGQLHVRHSASVLSVFMIFLLCELMMAEKFVVHE